MTEIQHILDNNHTASTAPPTTSNNNTLLISTYNNNGTTTTTVTGAVDNHYVTSDIVLWYFRLIIYGILCQILAVLGMTTNVINIIVYLKLGVRKDPVNVSLLGISISDFASCLIVTFVNLCHTPGFKENEDLPFEATGTQYLLAAWPYSIFVKITMVTTAFITVERCLCVTYPLKIKQIFTPRRVTLIIVSIYFIVITITSPVFYMARMKWVFFPSRNRTVFSLVYHESKDSIEPWHHVIVTFIIPFTAYFVTIVSTVFFVRKLKKVSKWRSGVTTTETTNPPTTSTATTTTTTATTTNSKPNSSSKGPQLQPRDAKVTKMVAAISSLYIICYTPITIGMIAYSTVPGLKLGGAYQHLTYLIFSFAYLLELTNASSNIFIYYAMSSNYKAMFNKVFKKNQNKS